MLQNNSINLAKCLNTTQILRAAFENATAVLQRNCIQHCFNCIYRRHSVGVIEIYTVSTKKLHPCIHCHNSGKQRRILTQFYANTETLNCKQVTKLQQNRSTSATATASLVRSLKDISVHYRHRRD